MIRKHRAPVVVDTNVFIRNFKARSNANPNRRVIRGWLIERKLQLIVSPQIVEEYLGAFANIIGMDEALIAEWRARFEGDSRTTVRRLARRYDFSRDPDDNVFLSTAAAGEAAYVITNDDDLLEVSEEVKRHLAFQIVTPTQFLSAFAVTSSS